MKPEAVVPCDGCVKCCTRWDVLRILPEEGDDPSQYQTEPHPFRPGSLMLAHQPNGDCIYLDRATGCTIHDRRPRMCRTMDCREFPRIMSHNEAQKRRLLHVYQRGQELIAKG